MLLCLMKLVVLLAGLKNFLESGLGTEAELSGVSRMRFGGVAVDARDVPLLLRSASAGLVLHDAFKDGDTAGGDPRLILPGTLLPNASLRLSSMGLRGPAAGRVMALARAGAWMQWCGKCS
mmetsp:Transcript_32338/g.77597  ORF Transcript_32338/g.77597 Transcript_32338/m.77597 type:complete len:121 (-) Transcript_32338:5-367(-)